MYEKEKIHECLKDNTITFEYNKHDLTTDFGIVHKEDLKKFPPIITDDLGRRYMKDITGNYGGETYIAMSYSPIL